MKKFKAVIKNYDIYNKNIKLATSLILNYQNKIVRDGSVGVSTEQFGAFWFFTPHGKVLFKTGEKRDREIRLLNEIICYRLAKNMGIDCAVYIPAQMDNEQKTSGVASFNFLRKGEKIVPASKLIDTNPVYSSMEELYNALEIFDEQIKFDYDQIMDGLYKMSIFDLLTFQCDRHFGNVSFIVDEKNKAKLSPLYDNEYAFFEISRFCFNTHHSSVYEFIDDHFYGDRTMHIFKTKDFFHMEGFNEFAKQIAYVAKLNPHYHEILKNMLANADIEKVYFELENEGYVINSDYKEFTTQLFNFSKKNLIKNLKHHFVNNKLSTENVQEK